MGEIKSTLDIVMEKTKHLTLTDEERRAQKKDEMTHKVRGLIQRCLDGTIDLYRMKSEMEAINSEDRSDAMALLIELCIKGFDFSKDNGLLIQILEEVAKLNTAPFMDVLSSFEEEMHEAYRKAQARFYQALKAKGISGSSLVPNVDADQAWQKELSRMQSSFEKAISAVGKDLFPVHE